VKRTGTILMGIECCSIPVPTRTTPRIIIAC